MNPNNDYNPYIIKICLFLFSISLYLFINALFFNDNKMHRIYIDNGSFNLIINIPQAIYSYIILSITNIFLPKLFTIQQNILEMKYEKNKSNIRARFIMFLRVVIIKFVSYFLFSIIILFMIWYYLSCFFIVFKNTQSYLIKISLISCFISLIVPFIFYLLPGVFRLLALKKPGSWLYKISLILQLM